MKCRKSAPKEGATKSAECTGAGAPKQSRMGSEVPVLLGKTQVRPEGESPTGGGPSDVETLSATALALRLRVLELEGFVQTLFDEIHYRAVDQGQTGRIDHD